MSQEEIETLVGINSTLIDVLNLKCVSSTLDIFSLQITFPFLMDFFLVNCCQLIFEYEHSKPPIYLHLIFDIL